MLIIRDSFLDTELVFLSMALKDIILLDIRHFDGSLESYIEQERPDIVMVMYTLPDGGAIDFNNHKEKCNFR